MEEKTAQQKPSRKRTKRGRLLDVVLLIVFIVVVALLLHTLLSQLSLRHEVAAAREVTNRTITDIASGKAADARSLGDSGFQKAHSTAELTSLFQAIRQHTHGRPVVDRQIVTNNKNGQAVAVIYKYPDKPQFYIRVITNKPKGSPKWHLIGISGNPSEPALLKF